MLYTTADEAQARQRVRQAEDRLGDALRGRSVDLNAIAQAIRSAQEQSESDEPSRDHASPEIDTRMIDLNAIADSVRSAQHQTESDPSERKIFVGPDGSLHLDSAGERVAEVTTDVFYGGR